jgi:hypothetical protein
MRQVAEKCQPVESLDNDPEDINIDQHHKNSADVDIPLEFNDPQVELGPDSDVGQGTYSEGQTQGAPDRRARVEEIEDEEAGSRIDGLKTFQVMWESGVIRHRVILRSCALNSRGKDYRPGHHSKTKRSGSWLSG